MNATPRMLAAALFAAGLSLLAGGRAGAQGFPSKPLTLVVPFAPGGAADALARTLGEKLAPRIGQSVVIENKPGAGGTIGAGAVARATADGHTLLFVTAGHAGAGALYAKLSFDPVKDFAPVIGLATAPIAIAVNAGSRYRTMADLVADARARPGKLNCAGGGGGATVTNLAFELLKSELKLDVAAINYKGSGPAMTALLSGEIDCDSDTLSAVVPHAKAGKLRALAVTTGRRSPTMPEVPTIGETVAPGFDASVWFGILAPAATPPAVLTRLNREFKAVLADPAVQAKFAARGADITGSDPAAFGAFMASETARWGGVIRKLGLKAN